MLGELWWDVCNGDWSDRLLAVLVLACFAMIASLPLVIWWGVAAERRWEKYASEHHCQAVAHRHYTYFIMAGKVMVPVQGTEVTYRCDGGEVIVR